MGIIFIALVLLSVFFIVIGLIGCWHGNQTRRIVNTFIVYQPIEKEEENIAFPPDFYDQVGAYLLQSSNWKR